MQVEIVSRELVKPSSSTPNDHPPIHNLSFFDQILPCFYVPLIFFYKTRDGETDNYNYSSMLKTSLSAVLSYYYPLAGRLRDNFTLDCNDEGVLFLEATTDHDLSEILSNWDDEILDVLAPDRLLFKDSYLTGPIAIQVTYFKCGGMSIGLCICHKMFDMASMSSFVYDWASLARKSDEEISPEFNIQCVFPPVDLPSLKEIQHLPPDTTDYVSKRLLFDGSNIDKLKAAVAHKVPNPTRVEVVSALLHKSALSAASKATSSGCFKSSVMKHSMNLRPHVSPPLSKRNKGNLSWVFPVSTQEDENVELEQLVMKFRQSKIEFCNFCSGRNNHEELYSMIVKRMKPECEYVNGGQEVFSCTSWCRFPFYQTDFGWGKPLWVATRWAKIKNVMILMDTREKDGIETFVILKKKVMAIFESDKELLSFSCVSPKTVPGL